jgi:2,3-bisphosphoglycerate-dependent phosphoglycerate mutase
MSKLILIRHGQSEWNELNLFTGWKNPGLTKKGEKEATDAGKLLREKGIIFDIAFTSALKRAQDTLTIILKEIDQTSLKIIKDQSLNERDYGDLSGLNKDEARKKWGEDKVHQWRRSFDIPPPGGESLRNTADRVLPYYESNIVPRINEGLNILITAHGNSLRSLVMHLDNISSEDIVKLEIGTGVPLIYETESSENIKRVN